MIHASRVEAFVKLGEEIENLPSREWRFLVESVQQNNPWFNEDAVALALRNIRKFLTRASIRKWLGSYDLENDRPLNIGVVMAGNIPAVGFHDLLCILISGNRIKAKLSSQDGVLLPFLKEKLIRIAPEFEAFISFVHLIKNVDAVIATGTDNTSRYFEYYFSSMPRIIRKNRTSIAVLRGDENKEDLNKLGHDIFQYFGLGCRNISKLFVPNDFNFTQLSDALFPFEKVIEHYKYANNYDYNKAIFLVNKESFIDTGFLLIKSDNRLVSPIGVVYYEHYNDLHELRSKLKETEDKIQTVVSGGGWFPGSISFGESQSPAAWDYADHVDTLKFLTELDRKDRKKK